MVDGLPSPSTTRGAVVRVQRVLEPWTDRESWTLLAGDRVEPPVDRFLAQMRVPGRAIRGPLGVTTEPAASSIVTPSYALAALLTCE